MRLAAPLLALTLAAGCVRRAPPPALAPGPIEKVQIGTSLLRIVHQPGDERAAAQVARAVRAALPLAERWGPLDQPVVITIHPGHAELEAAVRRRGYPWLRAWARYATIDLQSPSSWGLIGASDEQVTELLAHELTHCVMYQRAATEWTWSYKGIPLWFREGMASVTAGQGRHRGTVADLFRFYAQEASGAGDGEPLGEELSRVARGLGDDGDPLADPEPLYQDRSELVYAAAHRAFRFLLDRYGEARVLDLLARMRAGATYDRAFTEAIGIGDPAFESDFRRFVVLQGWRR